MQRRVVNASEHEEVLVHRKTGKSKIRGDVGGVRRDSDRRGKGDLLPPGGGFSGKGGLGQQGTSAAIEQANMCARVASAFVEPNSGDRATDIGSKLYAQCNRVGIVI